MGLFGDKPAWMSRNMDKAAIALHDVTDSSELIMIATSAPLWTTRSAAISKLKDKVVRSDDQIRATLTSIAQRDSNETVRAAAAIKLNKDDQTVLAQLATTSPSAAMRMGAIDHLRDAAALAHIAATDSNNAVRALALNRMGAIGGKSETVYNTLKAATLYGATELLLGFPTVPPNTYYVVETPDGNLGRDIVGFYTEAPLKTVGISLEAGASPSRPVDAVSLTAFGDSSKIQMSVAAQKSANQYASFVLLLECGNCGYKSPVETQEGRFERQCYACGSVNKTQRGHIEVITQTGVVAI